MATARSSYAHDSPNVVALWRSGPRIGTWICLLVRRTGAEAVDVWVAQCWPHMLAARVGRTCWPRSARRTVCDRESRRNLSWTMAMHESVERALGPRPDRGGVSLRPTYLATSARVALHDTHALPHGTGSYSRCVRAIRRGHARTAATWPDTQQPGSRHVAPRRQGSRPLIWFSPALYPPRASFDRAVRN